MNQKFASTLSFADDSYPDDARSQQNEEAKNAEQQEHEEEYSTAGVIWYYGNSDDKKSPCGAGDKCSAYLKWSGMPAVLQ